MERSQVRLGTLRRALILAEQRQRASLAVLARALDEAERATEELRHLYDEIEAAEQKIGRGRGVHLLDLGTRGRPMPPAPRRTEILSSGENGSASSGPRAPS